MKLRKKQVEHLDRLRELHSVLSESESFFVEGTDWSKRAAYADYVRKAQLSFFRSAVPEIKKIAGGYAETVDARVDATKVYLLYKGQDKNDIDLEFIAWLYPAGNGKTGLSFQVQSPRLGRHVFTVMKKAEDLTVGDVANKFQEVFGIR